MEEVKEGIAELIRKYRGDVEKLSKYLSWLESKGGEKMCSNYNPDEKTNTTMIVPIYDSTLLGLVKTAQGTAFMNRNYVYTYSRKKLVTAKDEHDFIDSTKIMDLPALGDILSSYVMKGMVKGSVWCEGVNNGVLYHVIKQMKELIEFWTVPM